MKSRINLLIAFAVFVMAGLCAIQYYLVSTAYDHEVARFRSEIKEKIAKVTDSNSDTDAAFFQQKEAMYKCVAESFISNLKVRAQIKDTLVENRYKGELTRKLQLEFEKEFPELSLDFAIVLNKFVLYNAGKAADTIYSENKPQLRNKIMGSLASLDDAFLVRNYVNTISGKTADSNTQYQILTEDNLYITIYNWKHVILQRMMVIFIFSVISILTVITLFVLALSALIKQKRVSDVKTDFINNITHELKTPLTTLSVSTKILERNDIRNDDEAYNTVLQTIARQNTRLQDIIDQVMTNSLGHEEIELKKEKIAANLFLTTIVNDFTVAFPDVAVSVDLKANETELTLDKFHLTTAIVNVLENAVKYGCSNIVVKTAQANGRFTISIADDGIGIPKSKQTLLFDKFYRVEEGNLHNTKGLGLGLYYVDQIIKAHRGSINVVSDLGKGALFHITIPSAA
ncbi:MAG TPA: HAMP domain-containing sensor histidine kinase [Flavobacterium sp.]|jgi:signal transduction histidine kinase